MGELEQAENTSLFLSLLCFYFVYQITKDLRFARQLDLLLRPSVLKELQDVLFSMVNSILTSDGSYHYLCGAYLYVLLRERGRSCLECGLKRGHD